MDKLLYWVDYAASNTAFGLCVLGGIFLVACLVMYVDIKAMPKGKD